MDMLGQASVEHLAVPVSDHNDAEHNAQSEQSERLQTIKETQGFLLGIVGQISRKQGGESGVDRAPPCFTIVAA